MPSIGLRRDLRPALALLAVLAGASAPAGAAVLQTKEAALAAAWPGAEVEPLREYLSEEEAKRVNEAAGTPLDSRAVLAWRGLRDGRPVGTAYLDRHLVRTLPETVLVFVSPAGAVERIEILTFDEPRDYLPPERWLAQFDGRSLEPGLRLKRDIRGITGATLSGRAVTDSVRRILAVHALLASRAESP